MQGGVLWAASGKCVGQTGEVGQKADTGQCVEPATGPSRSRLCSLAAPHGRMAPSSSGIDSKGCISRLTTTAARRRCVRRLHLPWSTPFEWSRPGDSQSRQWLPDALFPFDRPFLGDEKAIGRRILSERKSTRIASRDGGFRTCQLGRGGGGGALAFRAFRAFQAFLCFLSLLPFLDAPHRPMDTAPRDERNPTKHAQ